MSLARFGPFGSFISAAASDPAEIAAVLHGVLIRTRTFAELWVRPVRLTAEISQFLDRVWGVASGCERDEIDDSGVPRAGDQ